MEVQIMKRMTQDEGKMYLKSQTKEFVKKYFDWIGHGLVRCPAPDHDDQNPSCCVYDDHLYCYSCINDEKDGELGCVYDIFDLIGWQFGLQSFNMKFTKGCELFSVEIIDGDDEIPQVNEAYLGETERIFKNMQELKQSKAAESVQQLTTVTNTPTSLTTVSRSSPLILKTNTLLNYFAGTDFDNASPSPEETALMDEIQTTYSNHYAEFFDNGGTPITSNLAKYMSSYAPNIEFLHKRGISSSIMQKHGICFCPTFPNKRFPVILIPSLQGGTLRVLNPRTQSRYEKFGTLSVLNQNQISLIEPDVIIVVESELDALAIESVLDELKITNIIVLAMGSVSNQEALMTALQFSYEYSNAIDDTTIVLALDNDKAGRAASKSLLKKLNKMNLRVLELNLSGTYKDVGDYIQAQGTEGFKTFFATPNLSLWFKQEAENAYLQEDKGTTLLKEFQKEAAKKQDAPRLTTGFPELDQAIPDIEKSIILLAAESSLGKTTLAMAIALNMVAQGRNVIIFSFEMSKMAIIGKFLTNISYSLNPGICFPPKAFTDNSIPLTPEQQTHKDICFQVLNKLGDKFFIVTQSTCRSIYQITDYVEDFMKNNPDAEPPVVFADYIQLITNPSKTKPKNGNSTSGTLTEIENIKVTMTYMREFLQSSNCTFFCIAALNRAGVKEGLSLSALKGSSDLGYSGDIVLFMYYEAENLANFNAVEEKSKVVRNIELKLGKYREGDVSSRVVFDYRPADNFFEGIQHSSGPEAASKQMLATRLGPGVPLKTSPLLNLLNKNPLFNTPEGGGAQ